MPTTPQQRFNEKVLEILEGLITSSVGRFRPTERKHGIEGEPLWDKWVEARDFNEENV